VDQFGDWIGSVNRETVEGIHSRKGEVFNALFL
jgi:hypothetical protein